MSSWFLSWSCPNPGFLILCPAYWAFVVYIFLLYLSWGKLESLWSCHQSPWLCCSWGIIWSLSTSLQTLFSHCQTTLGLVPCSLAILPEYFLSLLLLSVLVLLTSRCLFFHLLCFLLRSQSVKILVVPTMPWYCLFI